MNKSSINVIWVFLISSLLTILVFFPIITNLNSTMLAGWGDGIKNYYTYLYQILYGEGTHFNGMNYPYGEHIIFTDNMPLLAFLISKIDALFPGVNQYSVGILHFLLFVCIPVGAVYAYKTLRQFNLPEWLSIIASVIIVFSCQQYGKISGHFGMAFMCYIPMQLYWLIGYHNTSKYKYLIAITLSCIAFGFLHLYNLAITLFIFIFYAIAYLVSNLRSEPFKKLATQLFPIVLAFIISYLSSALFMKMTDGITDRPDHPFGVFGGVTQGKDMFLNEYAPLGFVFQFIFGSAHFGIQEGSIYLGLATILTLTALIIAFLYSGLKKKNIPLQETLHTIHPRQMNFWLLFAMLFLLLGMGVPVSWGWTSLIDYISTLRQFRTVGRFSWVFYFIVQYYTIIVIYRLYLYWFKEKGKKISANVLLGSFLTIAIIQTSAIYFWFSPHKDQPFAILHKEFYGKEPAYDIKSILSKNGYKVSDFQNIIALPFFHTGSEKLWVDNVGNLGVMFDAMCASFQTGLPMSDVMMSRTSWSQTFEGVSIVDGPLSHKDVLKRYNDKKILIIKRDVEPLYTNEEYLVNNATLLGSYGEESKLYVLDKMQLVNNINAYRDSVIKLVNARPETEGLIVADSAKNAFYHVDHFENGTYNGIIGKAYQQQSFVQYDTLVSFNIPGNRSEEQYYQFLIWCKVNDYKYNSPEYLIDQLDANGNVIHINSIGAKKSTLVDNFWFLMDIDIPLKTDTRKVNLRVNNGRLGNEEFIALDEFLFIPKNAVYFLKKGNDTYLNNRLFKPTL